MNNDRKRPRQTFQSSSVCEISTETPQKQLSIRSFFGQKFGKNPITPGTPPPLFKPLETPPTSKASVLGTPQSSDISTSNENRSKSSNGVHNIKYDNKNKKRRLAQVFIDCGQKNFGQIVCSKCGTLYVPGVAEDEKMHKRECKQISQGVTWNTTNNCKIIKDRNSRHAKSWIVQIRPTELKKHKARLQQVLRIVEKDLGMHANSSSTMIASNGGTIFLFVRDQKVVGYLAVQSISTAYRMLNLYERDTRPISCMLGVAVLWTHPTARKQGIGTKLVDAARENAVFGIVVAKLKLAFSSPTEAGWKFAKNYCGNNEPLFYQF